MSLIFFQKYPKQIFHPPRGSFLPTKGAAPLSLLDFCGVRTRRREDCPVGREDCPPGLRCWLDMSSRERSS